MAKKKSKSTSSIRGKMREEHFASGGTVSQWTGTSGVHKNKKDKRKGRKKARENAIKDSSDG